MRAAGNMPSLVRPEVLQLGALIAVVVPPIQLDFDSLDLVLLRQQSSRIDVGGHFIARPGERLCCVKIEPALLQLVRAPILVDVATMAPSEGRISIPGLRIAAGDCRTGRGCGLVCAANQSNGKCC